MNDKIKSVTFVILLFFLFSGCTKTVNSVHIAQSFDYSIEQTRSCFCPRGGEPVRLFIIADTIADAVWISTNVHLIHDEWQMFRSIKGLFDEIAYWDSSSMFQLNIKYDSVYHYPSYVSIFPKPIIVNDTVAGTIKDAGVSYRTWNFVK